MKQCKLCGGTEFYKEAGYFFCQTCQTQNEDIREEVLELRIDNSTRLRKTRIRSLKSQSSGEELGWTSWEIYNFVLIGLTNELMELGVPANLKLTVLQLWATYLGKLEVAFISRKRKCVPKLAKRYSKRDAEIIYGKVQVQRRKRKRKKTGSSTNTSMISDYQSEESSMRELSKNKRLLVNADYDRFLQSQASTDVEGLSTFTQSTYSGVQSSSGKSSDNEGRLQFSSHAKEETRKIKKLSKHVPRNKRVNYKAKHISTQYKIGPHIITPMRLWAILYLALRIHNQPIQLGDMLRYGREGHLSYYKLDHLLPPEVSLSKSETHFLTPNVEITHRGMRRLTASMAKFLGVWEVVCPDFLPLVNRYCQELGLPRGIQLYIERLIALTVPKMTFTKEKSHIPNYEGRAMAFIIVVLKTLFALDDITEYQISRISEKINSHFKKMQLENYCSQLESRRLYASSRSNSIDKGLKIRGHRCYENSYPCIIVHGGAGDFNNDIIVEKMTGCKKAAINGYKKLLDGQSSIEAVETALWWLECDEFYNCSYGSVLNERGQVQMDASLMDGLSFKCGSVAAVSDIEHPISLAKYVLHNFPNALFVGDGAKNLAKYAGLNWISEGNMVAPLTRLALKSSEGEEENDIDNLSLLGGDMLTNSSDTVGCIAYDGRRIAVGSTTGGINKKLVGRVGDTPILGCGVFATRSAGCSVTGHGETIMKLGLSRAIVEDIEHGFTGEEALYKHFSFMSQKFDKAGGAVVFESNGRWATYFTSEKMPYAVIEDDVITFGARIHEEKREMYGADTFKKCSCECPVVIKFTIWKTKSLCTFYGRVHILCCSMAIPLGLLNEKLFSFREWQDYIEGRKTILTHSHFPTKIKYCPNTNGVDDLYIKFLEFVTSKADKKEPDVKNSKHCLSEELVQAMTKYIANLSSNDDTPKAIDIFPPSLTPLHSYLQYLLDNPLYDIPAVFRNDFFLTKVGYMTKPESLVELAMQCGIQLDIVDSRLHFIDKIVPPFEQPRMPSVDEMKELVDVENDTTHEHTERNENVSDYVYRKIPCEVAVDIPKELYYNSIRSTIENSNHKSEDFTFMETLPDGRLAIPDDSDNEEEEKKANLAQSITEEVLNLENKFYSRYNLSLTTAEKEAIRNPRINDRMCYEKEKLQLMRNSKGQFVKRSVSTVDHEERGEDIFSVLNNLSFNSSVQTNAKQDNLFLKNGIDINNIDMDNMDIDNDFLKLGESFNLSQISLRLDDFVSTPKSERKLCVNNNRHHFLRPFKDYWMYHCVFSRVKSKNFAVFEKSLPRSFRWLLNECALAVEMSGEELYEEVCLIESYLAYLSKNPHKKDNRSGMDPVSKSQLNFILKKW